jgi:hypothetical protein
MVANRFLQKRQHISGGAGSSSHHLKKRKKYVGRLRKAISIDAISQTSGFSCKPLFIKTKKENNKNQQIFFTGFIKYFCQRC